MKRVLAFVVLGLIPLYGSPYAALLLNRVMGPWSATAIEADGSTTWMEFGTCSCRGEGATAREPAASHAPYATSCYAHGQEA